MLSEERTNELKTAMKYELNEWWEEVDFNFVIENLINNGVIEEVNMDDANAYDDIYEVLSEAIRESFLVRAH